MRVLQISSNCFSSVRAMNGKGVGGLFCYLWWIPPQINYFLKFRKILFLSLRHLKQIPCKAQRTENKNEYSWRRLHWTFSRYNKEMCLRIGRFLNIIIQFDSEVSRTQTKDINKYGNSIPFQLVSFRLHRRAQFQLLEHGLSGFANPGSYVFGTLHLWSWDIWLYLCCIGVFFMNFVDYANLPSTERSFFCLFRGYQWGACDR